jgi:hypothetical protein
MDIDCVASMEFVDWWLKLQCCDRNTETAGGQIPMSISFIDTGAGV